jgi:hypothetical protein
MPLFPLNRGGDKKRIIGKRKAKEEERAQGVTGPPKMTKGNLTDKMQQIFDSCEVSTWSELAMLCPEYLMLMYGTELFCPA